MSDMTKTLRGLATINFFADDMAAAKEWYTEFLGIAPYFERPGPDGSPAYMEFRIGDYEHELGFIDRRFAPHDKATAGAVVYWHVDDLAGTLERLKSLGAKQLEGITERGPGFITASVIDPFGNILGIMTNVHYLKVLSDTKKA